MTPAQISAAVGEAWADRFDTLLGLEGAAWDRQFTELSTAWVAAYDAEFVRYAVSRGWMQEDAETWPDNIHDDAFVSRHEHQCDPIETARHDMRQCELDAEHE